MTAFPITLPAEAHTALGGLLSLYDWNWSEAEKELKRSLELNPNSSLAHERYTRWLQPRGRIAEAKVEARQAQHLDPRSFFINRELGRSLYLARRYEEALEQPHKVPFVKVENRLAIADFGRITGYSSLMGLRKSYRPLVRNRGIFTTGSLTRPAELIHVYEGPM